MAAIVIAPTGIIEKRFKFAGWFRDDHSRWGFRFSIIGTSISVIALTLTFYFAWMDRILYVKLEEAIDEMGAQRLNIDNMESKLGAIISTRHAHEASLSNIDAQIKALSTTIKMGGNIEEAKPEPSLADEQQNP